MADLIADLLEHTRTFESRFDSARTSPPWFRGHAQADWPLLPTALRQTFIDAANRFSAGLSPPGGQTAGTGLELVANDRFRTDATPFLMGSEDLVAVYMEARHAELPSRLLDWTLSPLIALFFACVSHPDKSGAVFTLSPATPYYYSRVGSQFPNGRDLMKTDMAPVSDDHPAFTGMVSKLFTAGDAAVSPSLAPDPALSIAFKQRYRMPLLQTSLGGVLPIRPRHQTARLAAQRSCFTFHPPEFTGTIPDGDHLQRFEVPAKAKEQALEDLRLLGIDEGSLWPGTDGVALAIRRSWQLP